MNDAKPYNEIKATSTTHGLGVLKRAVKELGARALDGRTTLAKELQAEQEELTQSLGGESEISPQERAIIQMIAQKRIRRKIAAQWALLNPDKLFDRRKRSFAPLALQLEQLEESEARLLEKLGLRRRAKQLPSLSDYLANGKAVAPPAQQAKHPTHGNEGVPPEGQVKEAETP
jgi:hypothetical protein